MFFNKKIWLTYIGLLCFSLNVFGQNNLATVNKINGFYIFTDNEPIAEYEVIGEVNSNGHNDPDIKKSIGQYQPVRDYLIKVARQVNYTADGLIFSLVNGGTDKAIIIKFKDNTVKKSQAKVNQYQGIYVFTDCVPIKESNYISTIKISGILTSSYQYSHIRDRMITKCKKENSNAKGIILKLVYGESDTGDAISFTD